MAHKENNEWMCGVSVKFKLKSVNVTKQQIKFFQIQWMANLLK